MPFWHSRNGRAARCGASTKWHGTQSFRASITGSDRGSVGWLIRRFSCFNPTYCVRGDAWNRARCHAGMTIMVGGAAADSRLFGDVLALGMTVCMAICDADHLPAPRHAHAAGCMLVGAAVSAVDVALRCAAQCHHGRSAETVLVLATTIRKLPAVKRKHPANRRGFRCGSLDAFFSDLNLVRPGLLPASGSEVKRS